MKQRHYYLNKLGIKSDDPCIFNSGNNSEQYNCKRFKKERLKYGFDSRELWSMDYTSACWLYEHIKLYKKIAGKIVDLNFRTFYIPVFYEIPENELEYNGKYPKNYLCTQIETRTQLEAIDFIIQYLEFYLKYDEYDDTEEDLDKINKNEQMAYEYLQGAFRIYAEILPSMWW